MESTERTGDNGNIDLVDNNGTQRLEPCFLIQ